MQEKSKNMIFRILVQRALRYFDPCSTICSCLCPLSKDSLAIIKIVWRSLCGHVMTVVCYQPLVGVRANCLSREWSCCALVVKILCASSAHLIAKKGRAADIHLHGRGYYWRRAAQDVPGRGERHSLSARTVFSLIRRLRVRTQKASFPFICLRAGKR